MAPRLLQRLWYLLRSFFVSPWTIEDYPIVVREIDIESDGEMVRGYSAAIDDMFIAGEGRTEAEARANLAASFEALALKYALPRPGTHAGLPRVASTTEIDRLPDDVTTEFIERVLRRKVFISDLSDIRDFPEAFEEYNRRTILLYNLDLEHLPNTRITTILRAIATGDTHTA